MAEEKKDVADKQQKKQHHNKDKEWGKPFPPEQSGNPAGRPKNDKMMSEVLRELLECEEIEMMVKANGKEINIHVKADRPLKYAVGIAQIAEAVKGSTKAFREITDRVDGRAVQHVNSNMPITYLISEEFMPEK